MEWFRFYLELPYGRYWHGPELSVGNTVVDLGMFHAMGMWVLVCSWVIPAALEIPWHVPSWPVPTVVAAVGAVGARQRGVPRLWGGCCIPYLIA